MFTRKFVLNLIERVVWTAVQAGSATLLVSGFSATAWQISGTAALIAAVKVIASTRIGDGEDGATLPTDTTNP